MNNTPAWLTIAVAGMTAVVALLTASITTWLTTKSANKRSATELEQQRARFAQELEHQRELERRKLLFGLRSEIYLKITQVFADAVTALSVSRSDRSEGNAETVLELAGALRRLQDLVTSCAIVASEDVTSAARGFGGRLRATRDWLARPDMKLRGRNFDDVWDPAVDAFELLTNAMRVDLGSIDDGLRENSRLTAADPEP
ncbi:hypothetical protein [Amycolatopsis sp. NBC_01286]|uniref:hypothetical protein n=1 Tax=Amycolatopsis sp. NBC_01286 TaxID=2903560 RepID=UPI002E14FCCC|nr:hypothetical protein OG570_01600 [Amycolatopsis sp. NBC_01286]